MKKFTKIKGSTHGLIESIGTYRGLSQEDGIENPCTIVPRFWPERSENIFHRSITDMRYK